MEITKITENYNFYKEGVNYVVDLGNINKGSKHTIKFKASDVKAKTFSISTTCGCTSSNKTVIDDTTVEFELTYSNNSTGSITKANMIKNDNKTTILKIKANGIKL